MTKIELQRHLLETIDDTIKQNPTFESCLNAQGMYETMRFVLRLSPKNHELVDEIVHPSADVTLEGLQAYSTYIHETIHWWQHVGSSSGLLFSLSYLAQSHSSMNELSAVLKKFGAKKSLKRWTDEVLSREGIRAQARIAEANIAVNNALDVEYYKAFAYSPKQAEGWLKKQQHFEAVGHGYSIVYGQLLGMLSDTIDPSSIAIPNIANWEGGFQRLRTTRHKGFYHGSSVRVPPVGLQAIYEGQARFIQLHFLDSALGNALTCNDWREGGYLSGVYVEAFEKFLELSKSKWPETISDPLIGLFLLICDLAINPTRGMPLDIQKFEDFIRDVDVGGRFYILCNAVSKLPHLRTAITEYSREEYIRISDELTAVAHFDKPLTALQEIASWIDTAPGLQGLMAEYKSFKFGLANLPLRVFFSHYISFSLDKLVHPQFFCWPSAYMQGSKASETTIALWLRHLSLFSDRGDKAGIFPRKIPGRDEADVKSTFESFFGTMALYDLTRQWIIQDGNFVCDFRWLSENYSQKHADEWGNNTFKRVYGVTLDDFDILKC